MLRQDTKVRIARPTNDLKSIVDMYKQGLGFVELGRFEDHCGFNGVMLGHKEYQYHLEFTQHRSADSIVAPHPDQLLIFYMPDQTQWDPACLMMLQAGFVEVEAYNPYWSVHGRTFEDLDGYRVVLQNQEWSR